MSESANMLTISSVPAAETKAEEMQIVASWKSTEKRQIPAANAKRAVILPANIWTEYPDIGKLENKDLRLHVLDSIAELARAYLAHIVEDSNWQRTQVNLDAFTLARLLEWQSEQAALSGRLNSDEIKQWLKQSATISAVSAQHGEKIAGALGEQFAKLAGPNHGLTAERATKILATLWKEEDAESNTGLRVMLRLQAISKKAQQSEDMLGSIL